MWRGCDRTWQRVKGGVGGVRGEIGCVRGGV